MVPTSDAAVVISLSKLEKDDDGKLECGGLGRPWGVEERWDGEVLSSFWTKECGTRKE